MAQKVLNLLRHKDGSAVTRIYACDVPQIGEHIVVQDRKYTVRDVVRKYPDVGAVDVFVEE